MFDDLVRAQPHTWGEGHDWREYYREWRSRGPDDRGVPQDGSGANFRRILARLLRRSIYFVAVPPERGAALSRAFVESRPQGKTRKEQRVFRIHMQVQFGAFVLDLPRRELRRDDVPVHLTPKAFDLLTLLVAEAPRVVTKIELHERLWPGTFVSEATLSSLVKEVRRALDDRHPESPVIRTAHRVGYAFCLDARPASPPAQPPAPIARPDTSHWLVLRDKRLPLREGENIVGRAPASDVWLDEPGVSRRHARIVVRGEDVNVEDLGSKNGTRVGDRVLAGTATLSDGERLVFGTAACVYRSSRSGTSTETRAQTLSGAGGSDRV